MSKKMWQKIFKTKSVQKNSKNKIDKNKHCSIYEEYQQLNGLNDLNINLPKQSPAHIKSENLSIQSFDCGQNENPAISNETTTNNIQNNAVINSVDERPLPAFVNRQQQQQQQHQHQQQSTFSKVVNTLTLNKRNAQQSNKTRKPNTVDSGNGNFNENDNISTKTKKKPATTIAKTKSESSVHQLNTPNAPFNSLTMYSSTKFVNSNCDDNASTEKSKPSLQISIVINRIVCNKRTAIESEGIGWCISNQTDSNTKSTNVELTSRTNNAEARCQTDIIEPFDQDQSRVTNRNVNNCLNGKSFSTSKYEDDKRGKIDSNGEEKSGAPSGLTPCPICSRKFNSASLSKHIVICEKMAAKKRKPFDSSRQRREGTELAEFLPKNFGLPPSKQVPQDTPAAEERLARSTARASTRGQSSSTNSNAGASTGLNTPTPVPSSPKPSASTGPKHERHSSTERPRRGQPTPATQKCPHCDRQFGLKAYDRHVEWCKEKSLQGAMKNSNSEKNKAKERLAARTKYRAPIKTKRSLNRDKYAGLTGDENEGDESPKVMTSSMISDRNGYDDISLCSQDHETFEKQTSHDGIGQRSYLSSNNLDAEDEKNMQSLPTKLSNFRMNQDRNQNICYERSDEFEDYSPEASMQSNQSGYRVARQFTEPNLRLHSMPSNKNQYFVDDMYPMLTINNPLYMQQQQQQQQQLQMRNAYPNCFPNPCVNFDSNPIEMKRKKKPHRKSGVVGHAMNPNMPLKAFSMPYGDQSTDGMPNMYAQMMMPFNLETKMPNFNNAPSPEWDEPSSGDEQNYIQLQANLADKPRLKSGLTDSGYNPFLSAKRQLEDLCASGSPPDNTTHLLGYNCKPLSTPTTPSVIIPTKMTTSLTLSASIPSHTSSLITPNSTQNRKQSIPTVTTTSLTPASNFRRTSSLRGPRRSPLLNARPFFAQKRPTIQRGLSDEGPISTNFLKSEEYDEIPVRSVCVNDFAITNSPRVIRRDTSLSNRKTGFKLNFHGNDNLSMKAVQNNDDRIATNAPKDLSKTDSLAVFLKYEHELEKLNQLDNGVGKNELNGSSQLVDPKSKPENPSTFELNATSKIASPVFTKELKDKSNNLSKQNSAKSLRLELEPIADINIVTESPNFEQHKVQNTPKQISKVAPVYASSLEKSTSPPQTDVCTSQVHLEPIQQSSQVTPASNCAPTKHVTTTNPSVKQPSQLPLLSQQPSITTSTNTEQPQTVNLTSLFGNTKPQPVTSSYDKENKALSSSTEFIDPVLINKCDNLPVKLADLKYADSDSSAEQYNQTRHDRHDRATDPFERYVAPISQLSKLLPLVNKTNANSATTVQMRNAQTQSTPKHTRTTVPPTLHTPQQQTHNTMLPRAATDNSSTSGSCGRNLLKRKIRLGRNQFLYDASPEALEVDSSCSADDETNPRSSAEYDTRLNNTFEHFIHNQPPQHRFKTPSPPNMPNMPNMPNLPIFDDFDFDEFLSSFENDEEEFPLFKNCREFLRNRPTNKIPTSTPSRSNSNKLNSTPKTPFDSSNYHNQNFFQFPVLNTLHQSNSTRKIPTHIITPSSRRSNTKIPLNRKEAQSDTAKSEDFHSARSGDSGEVNSPKQELRRDSKGDFKKREIFISIETEQNDELDRTPISPNSLRNMVGNSEAVVEVEVDANDNKFSKISDDDERETNVDESAHGDQQNLSARALKQQLPNVEMNNAKNLIQNMPEGIHGMDNEETLNNNAEEKICTEPSTGKVGRTRAGTGDSDEMSSLEGYPLASNSSSRRSAGVGSKMSADSAYGSLSRQRSNELLGRPAPRSSSRTRPATAATSNISQMQQQQFLLQQQYQQQLMLQQQQQKQQQQLKYAQAMLKGSRTRQLSGSSSSSSDNSLPPILVGNPNNFQQQHQQFLLQQQQQQMAQLYQQKARSRGSPVTATSPFAMDLVNGNHPAAIIASTSSTNGAAPSNKPMSRFCHECGSKFLFEHAKFCMDCGVKRLMI